MKEKINDLEVLKKIFNKHLNLSDDELQILFVLINNRRRTRAQLCELLDIEYPKDNWTPQKLGQLIKKLLRRELLIEYLPKNIDIPLNRLFEDIISACNNEIDALSKSKDDYIQKWELAAGFDEKIDNIQPFNNVKFIYDDTRELFPYKFIGYIGKRDGFEIVKRYFPEDYKERIEFEEHKNLAILIVEGARMKFYVYIFDFNLIGTSNTSIGVRLDNPTLYQFYYSTFYDKK